ncbi:hypothetical protein RB195_011146 [Necator americanus]|uniref:Uncharacterized protein n=1 Tax=Necator americanus TaxID=51031 RepID=A0ABR1D4F1_NECAM
MRIQGTRETLSKSNQHQIPIKTTKKVHKVRANSAVSCETGPSAGRGGQRARDGGQVSARTARAAQVHSGDGDADRRLQTRRRSECTGAAVADPREKGAAPPAARTPGRGGYSSSNIRSLSTSTPVHDFLPWIQETTAEPHLEVGYASNALNHASSLVNPVSIDRAGPCSRSRGALPYFSHYLLRKKQRARKKSLELSPNRPILL